MPPKLSDEEQEEILRQREMLRSRLSTSLHVYANSLSLAELELVEAFIQALKQCEQKRARRRIAEQHPLAVDINNEMPALPERKFRPY